MGAKKHLTKAIAKAAKAPAVGQAFIRDDAIKGLALRVLASGQRSFIWEGRINGRVRRVTLGQWPDIGVVVARAEAERVRAAIAKGLDPAEAKRTEKHQATFGGLRKRYIEEHSKIHKRSWLRDERRLERCKAWDARRLSDISADDASKLQQKVMAEHGRVEANRTLEVLRAVFNKASSLWKLATFNPALGFERFKETPRDRFLSDDELQRLNGALAKELNPLWRSYFPLLLLLGTRRTELLSAKWEDVDLEHRIIRLVKTKSGRSRLAPLPVAACELLRGLPSFGKNEYLFPGTGRTGHLAEPKSAWARLCKAAGLSGVTIHDLRRTVASRLAISGVNLPTIGAVLGHTGLNATQVYARLNLEAAARALEGNASTLFPVAQAPADPAVVADASAAK